jgi:hypothetical protein
LGTTTLELGGKFGLKALSSVKTSPFLSYLLANDLSEPNSGDMMVTSELSELYHIQILLYL